MELHIHGVGFEPTRLSTVELKSTPLDHSGIRALIKFATNSFNLCKRDFFILLCVGNKGAGAPLKPQS